MYQNCCKKCGSTSLHTEVKGNNNGLHCEDCGAWVKWLGKDELSFEYSKKKSTIINNKLSYGELRSKIHRIFIEFYEREMECSKGGEFDFEFMEYRTDEILRLIKRQGGETTI